MSTIATTMRARVRPDRRRPATVLSTESGSTAATGARRVVRKVPVRVREGAAVSGLDLARLR